MSPFTPQNFFINSLSAARLYPVPIASISTRSLLSSSVYGLSSIRYGAGGIKPSCCSTTRRGPSVRARSSTVRRASASPVRRDNRDWHRAPRSHSPSKPSMNKDRSLPNWISAITLFSRRQNRYNSQIWNLELRNSCSYNPGGTWAKLRDQYGRRCASRDQFR